MIDQAERFRFDAKPVAPLGVLDVLVIFILFGIILSAVVTELPRFGRHGLPEAVTTTGAAGPTK